jgi:hypothetical protein
MPSKKRDKDPWRWCWKGSYRSWWRQVVVVEEEEE